MENLSDSNMFSVAGEEVLAMYASHLCGIGKGGVANGSAGVADRVGGSGSASSAGMSGSSDSVVSAECLFLAFSETELSKTAKNALVKTAESFGIPAKKCLFAVCDSASDNACNVSNNNNCASKDTLSEKDIFAIVEGLDPKMLVICDNATCNLALDAYTSKTYAPVLPLEKKVRLFGRRCVAFASFESLLDSSENKQRAWAALKTLRD